MNVLIKKGRVEANKKFILFSPNVSSELFMLLLLIAPEHKAMDGCSQTAHYAELSCCGANSNKIHHNTKKTQFPKIFSLAH
jgi:hypothetical protein